MWRKRTRKRAFCLFPSLAIKQWSQTLYTSTLPLPFYALPLRPFHYSIYNISHFACKIFVHKFIEEGRKKGKSIAALLFLSSIIGEGEKEMRNIKDAAAASRKDTSSHLLCSHSLLLSFQDVAPLLFRLNIDVLSLSPFSLFP